MTPKNATQSARKHLNFRRPVLPERVRHAITEQQNESERLVGWWQLTVVVLFGFLYAVSPKTFSDEHTFSLVPWVLVVYSIFTALRLLAAYRGRLTAPVLYGSVVLDVGLLLGMIWAFHLQYNQPPTFYLKSPTLLYVFIFIALRALRFEARYVVAAGVVAAAGWVMMAVYALGTTGGWSGVTRDYVAYMTSNSILIGAELDKVVTILTVTAVLAVAITRARRLLIRAVTDHTAAHDLARFFSPEIAHRITTAEREISAGTGKLREAAILVTDIRNFSGLSHTVEPNDLIGLLAAYQSRLVPIIQKHGGTIDKFMGDGILATFGAVEKTDRFAADALGAVEEIMANMQTWPNDGHRKSLPGLRIGAAVAVGSVVFGAVGDRNRLEYTVIGEAVNIAAKLEKHTKKEGVRALATARTFDTALRQGFRPTSPPRRLSRRVIAGIEPAVDMVVVVD